MTLGHRARKYLVRLRGTVSIPTSLIFYNIPVPSAYLLQDDRTGPIPSLQQDFYICPSNFRATGFRVTGLQVTGLQVTGLRATGLRVTSQASLGFSPLQVHVAS